MTHAENSAVPSPCILQPEVPETKFVDWMIEAAPSSSMMLEVMVPAFILEAVKFFISAESIKVGCDFTSEVQGPLLPVVSKALTLP